MFLGSDAFRKPLRARDILIALGGLAGWQVVAALVRVAVGAWLSATPADAVGHLAGALFFGVVMRRFVYVPGRVSGPRASMLSSGTERVVAPRSRRGVIVSSVRQEGEPL